MTIILMLLYPIAVQAERGGWWLLVTPITFIALITWDFPAMGEWKFSTRLKRLQYYTGWRGSFARVCRDYCNFFDPGHV